MELPFPTPTDIDSWLEWSRLHWKAGGAMQLVVIAYWTFLVVAALLALLGLARWAGIRVDSLPRVLCGIIRRAEIRRARVVRIQSKREVRGNLFIAISVCGFYVWRFTYHTLDSERSVSNWIASLVGIVIFGAAFLLFVKQYRNEGRRTDWFFWPAFGPIRLHPADGIRLTNAADALTESYVDLCVASIELKTARNNPRRQRIVNEQDHKRGARETADLASRKLVDIAKDCLGKGYREVQIFEANLDREARQLEQGDSPPSRYEIRSAMDSISHQWKMRMRLEKSLQPKQSDRQTSDEEHEPTPEARP